MNETCVKCGKVKRAYGENNKMMKMTYGKYKNEFICKDCKEMRK